MIVIAAAATEPELPTAKTLWGASFVPAGIVTEIEAEPPAGTVEGDPVRTTPVELSKWNDNDSPAVKFEIVPDNTAGSELIVGDENASVGVPTVTTEPIGLSSPDQFEATAWTL